MGFYSCLSNRLAGLLDRLQRRSATQASAPIYPLPAHLASLLNVEEYNDILRLTIEQLSLKGAVESIGTNGVITIRFNGQAGSTHFYMDNLVRKCRAADADDWPELVAGHVKILPINSAAIRYIYKDFEFAAPLLKVQIKPAGFARDILPDCVYREDFPGTFTFLVIDFEEALHYVRRSEIGEWEVSDAYLFATALDNVAREKLSLTANELADGLTVFSLFHNDFAASAAVELVRNAEEVVGPYGAAVSIPAKGTVFIHPIEADTVRQYIAASHELIHDFYTQEVYSVTERYYWYYEGRYEAFPLRMEGNNTYLSYPARLLRLLGTS